MTHDHAPHPDRLPGDPTPADAEALDSANQSLAEALRRSFGVLKLLMIVLVGLYLLSGWFSVKPNEVGFVERFGVIRDGAEGNDYAAAVLPPGWHWSWPYPFEQWHTVSTSERELPVEFMFQLSDEEQTGGIAGYKYGDLSPERDDYLITGDVNIIHASLVVKYRVTDAIAYVRNLRPMPDPTAGPRSLPFRQVPEYSLLTSLARDAVIQTAAARNALDIRGVRQDEFLQTVASCLSEKLAALARQGLSLGIAVDPVSGVLAPKTKTVEAIMPPRQVQEDFDNVFAEQTKKARLIAEQDAAAGELLTQTAGVAHAALAAAIDAEYEAMLALSAAETEAGDRAEADANVRGLRLALSERRAVTESLLDHASGDVQTKLKRAQIYQGAVVNEAVADAGQIKMLLPEYTRNPDILISRLRDEVYSAALRLDSVVKWGVPAGAAQYRLHVPRSELPRGMIGDRKTKERTALEAQLEKARMEAKPNIKIE